MENKLQINQSNRGVSTIQSENSLIKAPSTILEIINNQDSRTFGFMKRSQMNDLAFREVFNVIVDAAKMVNVAKNLTEAQITFTAQAIIEKYPYLTIQDIAYSLRKGLTNGYPKEVRIFDRLDTPIIMSWLELHVGDRTTEGEANYHKVTKNSYKQIEPNQVSDEQFHEGLRLVRHVLSELPQVEDKDYKPKESDVQALQKHLTNHWSKQYNNLCKKFGVEINDAMYLKINNRNVDLQEFLKIKFNNLNK